VKAIISGFPEQQRRSWQTAFDTNAYPTVQSLLRAIMQESTRIHSNSDKLQEQTDFEAREPRHAGSKNEGGGEGQSGSAVLHGYTLVLVKWKVSQALHLYG
jgi:hypothetical protein